MYLEAEELAEIVMSAPEPTRLFFLSACESAKGGEATLQMSCWRRRSSQPPKATVNYRVLKGAASHFIAKTCITDM